MKFSTLMTIAPLCAVLMACQPEGNDHIAGNTDNGVTNSGADLTSPAPDLAAGSSDLKVVADRDGDGIADEMDPWPDTAPALSMDETVKLEVSISRTTPKGIIQLPNTVVSEKEVIISIAGTDTQQPLWLQWRGEGKHISVPVSFGENILKAPAIRVHQVALIYGEAITSGTPVTGFYGNEAWFYPVSGTLMAGSTVEIYGENLSTLSELRLGGLALKYEITNQDGLRFYIPALPESSELRWQVSNNQLPERRVTLPVYRNIKITEAAEIFNSGWHFGEGPIGGDTKALIPAGEPVDFYLVHPDQKITLSAAIWPDQAEIKIGARSTIEHWLYQVLKSRGKSSGAWQNDRDLIPDLDELLSLEMSIINDLSQGTSLSSSAYSDIDIDQLNWKAPRTTLDLFPYPAGTAPLYNQVASVTNVRSAPGKGSDSGIYIKAVKKMDGCRGLEAITAPAGLWGSDICIENTWLTYLSTAVKDRNGKVVRSHNLGQNKVELWANKDFIGPSGGITGYKSIAYMTSDKGDPLCHMQHCTVEFLTGGWGAFLENPVSLTPQERKIQEVLFFRTFVESVVLGTIASITGGSTSKALCMVNTVASDLQTLTSLIATTVTTVNKLKASKTTEESAKIVLETLLIELRNKFNEKLIEEFKSGNGLVGSCTDSKETMKQASSQITNRIIILKVAEIIDKAVDIADVAITPEKLVFSVTPRAEVYAVSESGDSFLSPDQTDTSLKIEGCHISNQKVDGSGQPEAAYNYWPKAVFTDSSGNTASMILEAGTPSYNDIEDQISLYNRGSSWCESSYTIPIKLLKNALSNLKFGTIQTDLYIENQNLYGGLFPNGELPLPGESFQWKGPPSLTGIKDGEVRPQLLNTLTGERLSEIINRDTPLVIYLEKNNSQSNPIKITSVRYGGGNVVFQAPLTLPPGDYTLRLLTGDTADDGVTLSLPVTVAPPALSYITLSDNGVQHDDSISVTLLGPDLEPLIYLGTEVRTVLLNSNPDRSFTVYFNGDGLLRVNGESATGPLSADVSCQDGGEDGSCTWAVHAKVKLQDGSMHEFRGAGKLTHDDYVTSQMTAL